MPPDCQTWQSRRLIKAFGRDPTLRFEYRLALELKMTRAELLLRMSGSEFAHWIAYFQREHREQQDARDRAEGKARAQQMARKLAGLGG